MRSRDLRNIRCRDSHVCCHPWVIAATLPARAHLPTAPGVIVPALNYPLAHTQEPRAHYESQASLVAVQPAPYLKRYRDNKTEQHACRQLSHAAKQLAIAQTKFLVGDIYRASHMQTKSVVSNRSSVQCQESPKGGTEAQRCNQPLVQEDS